MSYTILGVTRQRLCDYTTSGIEFRSLGKQSKVSKLGAGDRFMSDGQLTMFYKRQKECAVDAQKRAVTNPT